jgi:mono/diheme cytochrome c family protein
MHTQHVIAVVAAVLLALSQSSARAQRPASAPRPESPQGQRSASAQPQRIAPTADADGSLPSGNVEHGRYLVERVAMCVECHSGRDGNGNVLQYEKYLGGNIPFAPPWPNDWAPRAPRNRGLLGYDDKAALRLLTQGAIGRDGHQLRPPMPRFHMTPQDAADVIAFLRSLH